MYYYFKKTCWVFLLLSAFACTKEQDIASLNASNDELSNEKTLTLTRLGKKLINPFSIENMQIAMDSLLVIDSKNQLGEIPIKPTNLYVRFKPDTWSLYNAMMQNQTIAYFNHPLDYEVEVYGDMYRDPNLDPHEPGWLYAVVEPDYTFPDGLTYEVLDKLFIPDNYIETSKRQGKAANNLTSTLEKLETASFYLTGNLNNDELAKASTSKNALSKYLAEQEKSVYSPLHWVPQGTIDVKSDFNDALYPVPLLKIRVRDWFTIKYTFTDEDGKFQFDHTFNRPVSYACLFDNQYAVVNGVSFMNSPEEDVTNFYIYKGPHRITGHWNHIFRKDYDNRNRHYESATIHTAVYDYHNFRDRINFRPPPHLTIRLCNSNLTKCDQIPMSGFYRIFPNLFRQSSSSVPVPAFFKRGGFNFIADSFTDIITGNPNDNYNAITAKTYMALAQAAHWQLAKDNPDTSGPGSSSILGNNVGTMLTEVWSMGISDRLYREKFPPERLFNLICNYSELLDIHTKNATIARDLRDSNVTDRGTGEKCCFVQDFAELNGIEWNEMFEALIGVTQDRGRGLSEYQKDISALFKWRDNLMRMRRDLEDVIYDYFDQF